MFFKGLKSSYFMPAFPAVVSYVYGKQSGCLADVIDQLNRQPVADIGSDMTLTESFGQTLKINFG